jgi:hypothetical protein
MPVSQFGKHGREHDAEHADRRQKWKGQLSAARLAAGMGALLTLLGFGFFLMLEFGQ